MAKGKGTRKPVVKQEITFELVKGMADDLTDGCPFSYSLKKGDTAWNPSSTKKLVYGPCKITYRRYGDGGYTATIEDLD